MTHNCDKCKKPVSKEHDLRCKRCARYEHPDCAGISADSMKHNRKKYLEQWICTECRMQGDGTSPVDKPTSKRKAVDDLSMQMMISEAVAQGNSAVLSKMDEQQQLANQKLDDIAAKISAVEASQRQMTTQFQQHIADYQEHKKETQKAQETLGQRCSQLEEKVVKLEQYTRERNVIVSGFEGNVDYDLLVTKMLQAMGLSEDLKYDITVYHPIKQRKGTNALLIQFRNKEVKQQFMKNRRQAKVTLAGNEYKLYINHQLTSYYNNLLFEVKRVAKQKAKFIWYANCKVIVKVDENTAPVEIHSLEDIKTKLEFLDKMPSARGMEVDKQ